MSNGNFGSGWGGQPPQNPPPGGQPGASGAPNTPQGGQWGGQAPQGGYGGGQAPPSQSQPPPQGGYGAPQTPPSQPPGGQWGAPAPAPQSPPAGAPGGYQQPAAAPSAAPGNPFAVSYNPLSQFSPTVGPDRTRFPREPSRTLVRIEGCRLHRGDVSENLIVETLTVRSTRSDLLPPGSTPSRPINLRTRFRDEELTDLAAALAGYDKRRHRDRIIAEIDLNVIGLAVHPNGQGPGVFAGRYVLQETTVYTKQDGSPGYKHRFQAVPQPRNPQGYAEDEIEAILQGQFEVPEPPRPGQDAPQGGQNPSYGYGNAPAQGGDIPF